VPSFPGEVTGLIFSYFRAIALFLVLIFSFRLMGKRQIGQMEASEFVVTMLVANLASIPIENEDVPLHHGVFVILSVVALELVFAWLSLHNIRFRRLLCGKPVILIENGKICYENLKNSRITLDELSGQLRLKGVLDIKTVRYAILETNGSLSVFPYPAQSLPVTVISDGRLMKVNLKKCGKDENWVRRTLKEHHVTQSATLLLTVDEQNQVTIIPK
jgi:uncharacterized membrane protein YcaP (DUF421 family)